MACFFLYISIIFSKNLDDIVDFKMIDRYRKI